MIKLRFASYFADLESWEELPGDKPVVEVANTIESITSDETVA